MEMLKVIFISITQGITEFLPVSSSGHIFLLKNILNLQIDTTFDVVTHMGTLIAVIIVYFQELKELVTGVFKKESKSTLFGNNLKRNDFIKIFVLFIIATIPGGIAGILLEEPLDVEPSNTPKIMFLLIGLFFAITAIFLLSTAFLNKKNKPKNILKLSYLNSLFIGLFQSFAVLPGISRSGSTITASLFTNLNKKDAARFSFILSIPLIFAAFLLKFFKLIQSQKIADIQHIMPLLIGMIVSFLAGFISLKLLIKMLQKGKFWYFSFYLIIPVTVSIILWLK